MSNSFHLSLDVPDLDAAVGFYTELFGQEPAKLRSGYAKFELADPPVAIALQSASRPALSHLGIRVESTKEVEDAGQRLKASGLVTLDERDTSCCYTRQDKVWVADPSGNRWEMYTVLGDIEDDDDPDHDHHHASSEAPSADGRADQSTAACCTPTQGEAAACCT